MALNPLALARGVQPRVRDGVRGEAISITAAASPEWSRPTGPEQGATTSGTYGTWACETRLIVSAPGIPPAFLNTYRQMTRGKYLIPGLRVPVTVSERDRSRVRIEWDEVPEIDELIARGDPLFTDPDATGPRIREAFAAAGLEPPLPAPARADIDGPSARVVSFGGGPGGQSLSRSRKVDLLLSVALPGRPRFGYRWLGKAPRERMLRNGSDIPVLWDPGRPNEVDIPWDDVGFTRGRLLGAARSIGEAVGGTGVAVAKARALMRPGGSTAAMQQGVLLQQLAASGIERPATIRAFNPVGGQLVHLEVEVEPADGSPYPAAVDQPLPAAVIATLAAGQRVTVKVARDDPRTVMLWNTPHAPGGADPDTGRPV